jgi:hypothetical protein
MPQVKRAAKSKRPTKAVTVLGIAGVSWAASTGGSSADIPPARLAAIRYASLRSRLILVGEPLGLPPLRLPFSKGLPRGLSLRFSPGFIIAKTLVGSISG